MEEPRVRIRFLNKVLLLILDGFTKECCIAAFLFSKSVGKLVRGSGYLYTALYLKQATASLMKAYAGDKPREHSTLPLPISLNRAGYPTIIPSFHRKMLMRGGSKADVLVKVYLSFFSRS